MANGEFITRLACVIDANGRVARGYKIKGCELVGVNEYVITWEVPLHGGEAKTNFAATIGSAMTEPVEPGFVTVSLDAAPDKMRVRTYGTDGNPARRPFHIAAFRDR
jgi:hypothetical protein